METDDKKLKVEIPIVVEGRSDTRAVMKAVDGLTIETHGYGISRIRLENWIPHIRSGDS